MNEIEKMYENAGVEKINTHQSEIDNGDPRFTGISHSDSYIKYPPFTAEKQLNILDALLKDSPDRGVNIWKDDGDFRINVTHIGTYEEFDSADRQFSVALAKTVNNLWQDLTREERKQIKEILE